ncbi:MAG: hypothetical protein AAF950_10745 [Pseudomonadota bacterium]
MIDLLKTCAGSLAVLSFVACGGPADADQRSFSEVLAEDGLSGVPDWSAAQDAGPGAAYLSGMAEALSAIEHVLQVRYATYSGELPLAPGGQIAIAYNPDAKFDPAFVETAAKGALEHFARADLVLRNATGKDFAVEVNLAEIWFDINADGTRNEGEDALDQIGFLLGEAPDAEPKPENTVVRFDSADADWLSAYVHLASASAELLLSVDPTSAISTVFEGNERMRELGVISPDPFFGTRNEIDTFAVVLAALDGVPDAQRTQSALAHLKEMVEHNRAFWAAVAEETDNENEWLPNANQTSAFGVQVTAETAANWQTVLSEMEQVLNGEKLIPHWRISEGNNANVGINLESLLNDPGDFQLALLLHGASLAPHMEEGELVDLSVWREFSLGVGGQGIPFALWLN